PDVHAVARRAGDRGEHGSILAQGAGAHPRRDLRAPVTRARGFRPMKARELSRSGWTQEPSARAIARLRKAWPISPREMATIRPSRSMTKLSGSWSVP